MVKILNVHTENEPRPWKGRGPRLGQVERQSPGGGILKFSILLGNRWAARGQAIWRLGTLGGSGDDLLGVRGITARGKKERQSRTSGCFHGHGVQPVSPAEDRRERNQNPGAVDSRLYCRDKKSRSNSITGAANIILYHVPGAWLSPARESRSVTSSVF